jgi:hypothetical protein
VHVGRGGPTLVSGQRTSPKNFEISLQINKIINLSLQNYFFVPPKIFSFHFNPIFFPPTHFLPESPLLAFYFLQTLSTCFFFALFTPLTHFFFPFSTRGIPSPNASLYTPSALAISMISFYPLSPSHGIPMNP